MFTLFMQSDEIRVLHDIFDMKSLKTVKYKESPTGELHIIMFLDDRLRPDSQAPIYSSRCKGQVKYHWRLYFQQRTFIAEFIAGLLK